VFLEDKEFLGTNYRYRPFLGNRGSDYRVYMFLRDMDRTTRNRYYVGLIQLGVIRSSAMRDEVGGRGSCQRKRLRLIRSDGRYDASYQLEPSCGSEGGLLDMSRPPFLHSSMAQPRPRVLVAPPIQLDPCRLSNK
jgi:hypothetical protein